MSQRVLITAGAAGIGLEMVRAFVATSAKGTLATSMAGRWTSWPRIFLACRLRYATFPSAIIAALAVFLAAKAISGQMLPIDVDMQRISRGG